MPSPFPGMNPYLEQPRVWSNVHAHALPLFVEHLVPQVVPAYIVTMEEQIYIQEMPDGPPQPAGVIDAPAWIRLHVIDFERLALVEIRERTSRKLITVVGLLSPSNKNIGSDRETYLNKRRQILASSAHFVEIDLLRGGPPMPAEDRPGCDYAVMVSRAEDRPRADFWPIGLRERLPVIPVPLRAPDSDARLDLQAVLDHIYDRAGYAYYIYDGEPEPPLRPEDAEWARALVPARG